MQDQKKTSEYYRAQREAIAPQVLEMRAKGWGLKKIAEALGPIGQPLSENHVRRVLDERGLYKPLTGAKNPKKTHEARVRGKWAHLK